MKKEIIIENCIGFPIVIAIALLMIFGGLRFLIISGIFLALVAIAEFLVMRNFYVPNVKLMKKIPSWVKMINGFLWIHGIVKFAKTNGTTIYEFKKIGFLPFFTAYFIIFLYILIAFFLFKLIGNLSFLIYLVPIITNVAILFDYNYHIYERK